MAESSYPQPGLKPGDGPDCGAYTANQWRGYNVAKMRSSGMIQSAAPVLPTVAQYPDVGVFYVVPNRLAVTSPGANQISIATGASLVDGTLHYSDTAHTAVAITNPGANPRIDVVVVRQNYTGIDYTSVNAPALVVTANTARIAIISGAENIAPVAPALTQDTTRATYWDIPLAQYQIAVGGVITNLTDRREWVDAEVKKVFVPFINGRNITDGVPLVGGVGGSLSHYPLWILPTNKTSGIQAEWRLPQDFISGLNCTPVLGHPAEIIQNFRMRIWRVWAAACGETLNQHPYNVQNQTIATGAYFYQCLTALTLNATAATEDDFLNLYFERQGTHVEDAAGDLMGVGVNIEYLGWGRK